MMGECLLCSVAVSGSSYEPQGEAKASSGSEAAEWMAAQEEE